MKDRADVFVEWLLAEPRTPEVIAMRYRKDMVDSELYATKEAQEQVRLAFERRQAIENAPFVGGGDK